MATNLNKNLKMALFAIGRIVPNDSNEIEQFEYFAKKNKLHDLPEIFDIPSEVVKQALTLKSKGKDETDHKQERVNNEMARAAREGKSNLSPDVLRKMKRDRDNAQNGEKNNRS